MITGAHFLDARLELFALEESDEDGLVKFVALKNEKEDKNNFLINVVQKTTHS